MSDEQQGHGALTFDDALALPCDHLAVITAADPGDNEIHILMQRGEGGLYATYCPHTLRVLAQALMSAADHVDRLAALGPVDTRTMN